MRNILICLVSKQVMANIIPINELKPDEVILLTTKEEKTTAETLLNFLEEKKFIGSIYKKEIDAYNPQSIRTACKQLIDSRKDAKLTLNSTGGTKIMAMVATDVFRTNNLDVIYADNHNKKILFFYPISKKAKPITGWININDYLLSNGYKIVSEKTNSGRAEAKENFLFSILKSNRLQHFIAFFNDNKTKLNESNSKTTNTLQTSQLDYSKLKTLQHISFELSKSTKNFWIKSPPAQDKNALRLKKSLLAQFVSFWKSSGLHHSVEAGYYYKKGIFSIQADEHFLSIINTENNSTLYFPRVRILDFNNFINKIAVALGPITPVTFKEIARSNNFSLLQEQSNFVLKDLQTNATMELPFRNTNTGDWLEDLLYLHLKATKPSDIKYGVIIEKNNLRREIDVILTRGYNLEIYSCKDKSNSKENNRLDLYELEIMRELMGGPYGKANLVVSNSKEYLKSLANYLGIKVSSIIDTINSKP